LDKEKKKKKLEHKRDLYVCKRVYGDFTKDEKREEPVPGHYL